MNGSPEHLTTHSAALVPREYKELYMRVVKFILHQQFILSGLQPSKLWLVCSGSGMGLKFSSFLANAAFCGHSEISGLSLLDHVVCNKFAVKTYIRYADNLLFICRPEFNKIQDLIRAVTSLNAPYKATIEETGAHGVTFLDVDLCKDNQWLIDGRISVRPHLKASGLRSVLLPESAHPTNIHGAWTLAYIHRMQLNSSSLACARIFKDVVLDRMSHAGIDRPLIQEIDRLTQFTFKHRFDVQPEGHVEACRDFWIPLPYHALYSKAVKSALHQFTNRADIQELCAKHLGERTRFGVACKLANQPLVSVVRKY